MALIRFISSSSKLVFSFLSKIKLSYKTSAYKMLFHISVELEHFFRCEVTFTDYFVPSACKYQFIIYKYIGNLYHIK